MIAVMVYRLNGRANSMKLYCEFTLTMTTITDYKTMLYIFQMVYYFIIRLKSNVYKHWEAVLAPLTSLCNGARITAKGNTQSHLHLQVPEHILWGMNMVNNSKSRLGIVGIIFSNRLNYSFARCVFESAFFACIDTLGCGEF